MKSVGIIGHFAIGCSLANGQTIKTKIITEEIENYWKEKAYLVDSHGGIKAVMPVIFGSVSALKKCRNVILMLTENGLRVSVPVLTLCNKIFHRKLHYVVIGGWLPEFLKRQPGLSRELKKFHKIYVETQKMKADLLDMGFENVTVMPNCKRLHVLSEKELKPISDKPYPLCTFSRVMKEKGIADALQAVCKVNQLSGKILYTLDIYGQIEPSQAEWFEKIKVSFPEYITYGGVIDFDQSTQVLKNYFALLFPTYYVGEGFAGTILDAFSAGVPVLASNWKYNKEIIKNNVNGKLFEPHNVDQLSEELIHIADHPSAWNKMRTECIREAEKYRPEYVLKVLFDQM